MARRVDLGEESKSNLLTFYRSSFVPFDGGIRIVRCECCFHGVAGSEISHEYFRLSKAREN